MNNIIYCFILATVPNIASINGNTFENQTKFVFYGPCNEERYVSTSKSDSLSSHVTGCDPAEPFALIVHGWMESCQTPWAVDMRSNLLKYRKGCIICMDYSAYDQDYTFLVTNFNNITQVLLDKFNALETAGFRSKLAYVFGFSFGARLIASAGVLFGKRKLQRGDMCEPAGPGFDMTTNSVDPKDAFKENQCVHTNRGGLGTTDEVCLQDWNMGDCGESQLANRPFPNGNHGLCPQFYNSAFTHKFLAVPKKDTCNQTLTPRDATSFSPNMRMGYFQTLDPQWKTKEKTFYAITTKDYPFNGDLC